MESHKCLGLLVQRRSSSCLW